MGISRKVILKMKIFQNATVFSKMNSIQLKAVHIKQQSCTESCTCIMYY